MATAQHCNYLIRLPSTLLLCSLFAVSGAMARSDNGPVFLEAVKLPIDSSSVPMQVPDKQQAALFAFESSGSSASILAALATLEDTGDLFSPALAEYTAQLGAALQREGQHVSALQAFERSLQIMRRNEGLRSKAQVSVLQAQIASQLALADMVATDGLHRARFTMEQQLYAADPLKLAESFTALADWEIRYYFHDQQADWQTDEQRALLADRLADAFLHYHKALWNLSTSVVSPPYESKVAVERKIAAIALLVNQQFQSNSSPVYTKAKQRSRIEAQRSNNQALFEHGTSALSRVIEYSEATAEPEMVAARMLELADWYLLLNQYDEARRFYGEAAVLLNEAGTAQQRIDEIMQSGLPVHDPARDLAALTTEVPPGVFEGYVDVVVDVNRYGEARNARLETTATLDEATEQSLLQRINAERFRPGFDQGMLVDNKNVTLRYYFAR